MSSASSWSLRRRSSGIGPSPSQSRSAGATVRHFDLPELVAGAGASFSLGEVVSVDTDRKLAYTAATALSYDVLLLACGTLPQPAVPGALTFRGPADTGALESLLGELGAGTVRSVVFAVPAGAVWSLPAYELALLTAAHLSAHKEYGVTLELVTPENTPLELFGEAASEAVASMLAEAGIGFRPRVYPAEAREGELLLVGGEIVPADRVVAMPRLQGPRIGGIPQRFDGFVPVDEHGRVKGLEDVYAAGDITDFATKQGGLATQQADAAAEAIAAAAGADVTPKPFRPVLRGILLTGSGQRYIRRGAAGDASDLDREPRAHLVAAREDRGPVPGALPRADRRRGGGARAIRGGRRRRGGRARAPPR